MILQKRHLPIFLRILLMFLVAVIPVYVCGLWINMSSQKVVKDEIYKSTKPKIDFYVNMLENEFKNTIQMRLNFFTDKDLQSLSIEAAALKNYDKYITMQHMEAKLARFKDVSNYIKAVSIYIPLINKAISDTSVKEMSNTEFDKLKGIIQSGEYPFVENDNKLYMYTMPFSSQIVVNGKEYPPYIISIEISKTELLKTLQQFSGYGYGNAFLVSYEKGLDITGHPGLAVEKEISGYLGENIIQDTDTHIMSLVSGNENYIVIYKKSSVLGTYFVSYLPEKILLFPLSRYHVWLWIASIITISIILLFSVWIYRIVVKPLNTLIRAFDRIKEGDFNIALNNSDTDEFGRLNDEVNIICKRLAMFIEQLYEKKMIMQNLETKQDHHPVNSTIYGMLDSIQLACKQIYGIWASSTTSGKELDWDKLNGKFDMLEQMMKQASGLNDDYMTIANSIIGDSQQENTHEDDKHIREALKSIQFMEILLESGQKNEFFEIYNSFILIIKKRNSSNNMKLEAFYSLAALFLSCLNKMGMTERITPKFSLQYLTRMDDHLSWDEVDAYFRTLANFVFEQINADNVHYSNRIISYVDSFIEENISNDLSLTTISEKLHFNPSYFSRLFKNISGKGFAEYISESKITKAKEMLAQDDLKIIDIARHLGFEQSSSFTRFFRKYTNQSPQEYKDSIK